MHVASASSTASEPAIVVIDGIIPVPILAVERLAIYHGRSEADRKAIATEERNRRSDCIAGWEAEPDGEEEGVARFDHGRRGRVDTT